MTKICVPIAGDDMRSALELAHKAIAGGADLVEIRADLIPGATPDSIGQMFGTVLGRSVITLRSRSEGGGSDLIGNERSSWIRAALELPAAYIDLEIDTDSGLIPEAKRLEKKTIVSKHFFDEWDEGLVSDYLSRCCEDGSIGKVAARVESVVDAIDLLKLIPKIGYDNHALMAMGTGAEITRAIANAVGSSVVFCALDSGKQVAPGQLDLRSQKRVTDDNSVIVGLIGHPLHHSLSPVMHNAAFDALGIPGIYLPFDIPNPEMVDSFLRDCADLKLRGMNVTIPYKEVAFRSVDEIEGDAQRVGAINTIVIDGQGGLHGYNTDIFGFSEAVRISGFDPSGKRALVVGAGGAARAAVLALDKLGAEISIANRTPERAVSLISDIEVNARTIAIADLTDSEPFSFIVNATPVGMTGFGGSAAIPGELVAEAEAVMDMIYNPLETRLISDARSHGKQAISGLDMLLYQGAKAFELWTGKRAPIDIMREALKKEVSG